MTSFGLAREPQAAIIRANMLQMFAPYKFRYMPWGRAANDAKVKEICLSGWPSTHCQPKAARRLWTRMRGTATCVIVVMVDVIVCCSVIVVFVVVSIVIVIVIVCCSVIVIVVVVFVVVSIVIILIVNVIGVVLVGFDAELL